MRFEILFVFAAACGGGGKPAPTPVAPSAPAGDHAEHHEMKMAPELAGFHDVLKPRWHAPKGEQRMQDTCAAIPQFQTQAESIAKAKPSSQSKELGDAVSALDTACKANDAAVFELAFAKVHDTFHAMMEGGGEHQHGHEHGN
jgi:hypothetical protein